jgi:hypothetical protein
MPALGDLEQYVDANNWRGEYAAALPAAQRVATRIPLVHVTGNENRNRIPFERLILDSPHEIPTAADLHYCGDLTRQAEDLLGLPRSCYFYAGRAHPQYGSVALAFAAGCEADRDGSATPFDSGALVHPTNRLQLTLAGGDSDANRIAFARASQLPLPDWRREFARFLAAYFQDVRSYWLDRPVRVDPEEVFILNNDWVAWTFEIRFDRGPSIHDRLTWCADSFVMSRLRRLEMDDPLPTPGSAPTPLQRFLQGPAPLAPAGSPDFHTEIEAWFRQYVGL